MADIFREVDEELRRERASDIWRKYGTYIVAVVAMVVLATAGYVAWYEWRQAELRSRGAEFYALSQAAAKDSSPATAASLSDFAAKADDGYALLARLEEAALRAKQGDRAGAVAIYDRIAAEGDVPQTYRDLAVILTGLNGFETADARAMIGRLAPITAETNPMRFSALELTALFERKSGNPARAREIFQQIADAGTAPGPVRERAREMLEALPAPAGVAPGSTAPATTNPGDAPAAPKGTG